MVQATGTRCHSVAAAATVAASARRSAAEPFSPARHLRPRAIGRSNNLAELVLRIPAQIRSSAALILFAFFALSCACCATHSRVHPTSGVCTLAELALRKHRCNIAGCATGRGFRSKARLSQQRPLGSAVLHSDAQNCHRPARVCRLGSPVPYNMLQDSLCETLAKPTCFRAATSSGTGQGSTATSGSALTVAQMAGTHSSTGIVIT